MENKENNKIFANGMMFKRKNPKAPDFVKGHVSVMIEDFTTFLKAHNNRGWANFDLKESKGGKLYFELNTWKKDIDDKEGEELAKHDGIKADEIPF